MKNLYKKKERRKGGRKEGKKGGENNHTCITILSLGRAGRGMGRKTT